MSAPRFVAPGTTYLLTRRCLERRLRLRPSVAVNQIVKFCLGVAAMRSGVQIHGFVVLSNHYHIVATDPLGSLPIFMHWFNEYVAKCMNAHLGRWESFWAPGSYSAVALGDHEAVVDRLVYVYTNPVEAGLVRTHTDWPGAHSRPEDMGSEPTVVQRPEGFFRAKGPVPETVALRLVPPPGFKDDRAKGLPDLEERVRAREAEICAKFDREGRRFLGRRRVLRQSPFSRPRTTEPRRGLNPRVAARDKWKRIESLQRLKSFSSEYRQAWKEFSEGNRTVIFPFGTYAMQARLQVVCHGL